MQQQDGIAVTLARVAGSGSAHFSRLRCILKRTSVRGSAVQQKVLTAIMACSITVLSLAGAVEHMANAQASLTTEQINSSVHTAMASTPGRVLKAEAKRRNGAPYCDVQVRGANGKISVVVVEVASNKVVAVEAGTWKYPTRAQAQSDAVETAVLAWPMPSS